MKKKSHWKRYAWNNATNLVVIHEYLVQWDWRNIHWAKQDHMRCSSGTKVKIKSLDILSSLHRVPPASTHLHALSKCLQLYCFVPTHRLLNDLFFDRENTSSDRNNFWHLICLSDFLVAIQIVIPWHYCQQLPARWCNFYQVPQQYPTT